MPPIADSNAVRFQRVLPQHQAALTLLQGRLANPAVSSLSWLDLACGRGQIIAALEENLSSHARQKLRYHGFDLNNEYLRETKKTAESLNLAADNFDVGELSKFNRIIDKDLRFDFITFTNTIHEVDPRNIASILYNCLTRLAPCGILYVYDMERISPFEMGAIPWTADEARSLVATLLNAMGIEHYKPEVGRWGHSSCDAWNIQIDRTHISLSNDDLEEKKEAAIEELSSRIKELLEGKKSRVRTALESFTLHGAETAEEEESKVRMLFDFWALSRIDAVEVE